MVKKTSPPGTLGSKITKVLKDYLVTQFVLMVVIFVAVLIILTFLNVKYALLLAILTGVLSIIPNYGMIISSLIVGLVAIFDKVTFLTTMPMYVEGVVVIIILVLLNKLSDTFLTPILISKSNNLNPLLIFFIVIIGTLFFGVIGAVLAVPIFLVLKTVLDHYKQQGRF